MPTYYQKHKQIQALPFDGTMAQIMTKFPSWATAFFSTDCQIKYDDHHLITSIQKIDGMIEGPDNGWWPFKQTKKHRKKIYEPIILHRGDYLVFYTHVVPKFVVDGNGEDITPAWAKAHQIQKAQLIDPAYWQKIRRNMTRKADFRFVSNHLGPDKAKIYDYALRRYFTIWHKKEFESQWSKYPIKKRKS